MDNYKNIKIEKSMYNSGKSFSEVLEEMDPSSRYEGTELEGSDAFQRQLKRFDIKVTGPNSDRVEKFFQTSDSSVLFPEYVSRAVKQGMGEYNRIENLAAASTIINGVDYRTIRPVMNEQDKALANVAEGAVIPQVDLKISDELVKLNKRGRMLVASYEAVRFQRIDVFTVALKQIGEYIAVSQMEDFIAHLEADSDSGRTMSVNTALTYSDLLNLWSKFETFEMNTILCSPDAAKQILSITDMKDSVAGFSFSKTGRMITPLGANLIVSGKVPEGTIYAFDKNYAVEYIQSGDVITEYDKLIDRQLERAAVTVTSGYATLFSEAVYKVSITN